MKGVFLEEGETVGRIDTKTGEEFFDELEDERKFESTQIETDITVLDTNRKIIQEVAEHAYAHEEKTGNFPKILIFAVNDIQHVSHADQTVKVCREIFGQGDEFVQKITGNPNVDRPLQKIREFRNRPKEFCLRWLFDSIKTEHKTNFSIVFQLRSCFLRCSFAN